MNLNLNISREEFTALALAVTNEAHRAEKALEKAKNTPASKSVYSIDMAAAHVVASQKLLAKIQVINNELHIRELNERE